jgi:hypothetical protein
MPREITSMSDVGVKTKHAEKHNRHIKKKENNCKLSRLHGLKHNLKPKGS